jgi:hypothetical protein
MKKKNVGEYTRLRAQICNLLRSPAGINSASLCILAGQYGNPIPTPFLGPSDCYKIPALASLKVYKFGLIIRLPKKLCLVTTLNVVFVFVDIFI